MLITAAPSANHMHVPHLTQKTKPPHTKKILVVGVRGVIARFTKWRKLRHVVLAPAACRSGHLSGSRSRLICFSKDCYGPFITLFRWLLCHTCKTYNYLPLTQVIPVFSIFFYFMVYAKEIKAIRESHTHSRATVYYTQTQAGSYNFTFRVVRKYNKGEIVRIWTQFSGFDVQKVS